ncbi:hypothetical protein V6N12_049765 [Hibiscus sabdariffa]|uniref:Uncharacterized protein n=1 Tax=Hibiscus sabdariffa TaxID=183260 RepID=A0ABR2GBL8_9ROSI
MVEWPRPLLVVVRQGGDEWLCPFKVAPCFPSKDRLPSLHSLQLWLSPYASSLYLWLAMVVGDGNAVDC